MNRPFLSIVGVYFIAMSILLGQTPTPSVSDIAKPFETSDWLQFRQDVSIPGDQVFEVYAKEMGLGTDDRMQLTHTDTDEYGITHYQYQQYHDDVPVEFAIYRIHARDGIAVKGNGVIESNVIVPTKPSLTETEALELALDCIGAHTYNWEVPALEKAKQHATGDPSATFFPEGELLIVDRDFDPSNQSGYGLAWKFEIHSSDPSRRDWVYVDAQDGHILKELDLHMHEGVSSYPGVAETRYSGTQEIIADSTELGFVLRDNQRGRGVETYDAVDSFSVEYAEDFMDDDNYWDNANERADDAATDCHWAAEQLYDYLLQYHNWNSYDNKGSKMISYVHYGQSWRNASWNGFWGQYGDASGEPWVNVDVVGHEFAHGFTWATSGLLYTRESGAMNESFSDILGEALQYYINSGETDWLATPSPIDTIRDYAEPGNYRHPDTYLGVDWRTTPADNYGVHSNSGVQNKWFYLLVNGGEGVNDNGDEYAVQGIGMDAAMAIIFRSMTTYLFPTATYFDRRQSSLFSTEDIFGTCSEEYKTVANAWHAVGVGERVENDDFTVVSIEEYPLCDLSKTAPLTINLRHMGCDSSSPVVIEARVAKSNNVPPLNYTETIEIPEGVGPGELFSYTFKKELDFSRRGEHTIQIQMMSESDLNTGNDVSEQISAFNISQIEKHEFRFYTNIAARTFRDSMAFYSGEFTDVSVLSFVGRDSTAGIMIEGDQPRYANPILEGEDLFDDNERLGTQICMCMDATELDSLGLQFDLRQTYSNDFEEYVQLPQPKTSALRVMAGDTELGRYFPETNNEDDWQTHNIDLEEWLGLEFTLCFETRTIQSLAADHDSIGDRVFLDNIIISSVGLSSSTTFASNVTGLDIFPNPATTGFTLQFDSEMTGRGTMRVINLNGSEMLNQAVNVQSGSNQHTFDISGLNDGVYVIELTTNGQRYLGKLAVL